MAIIDKLPATYVIGDTGRLYQGTLRYKAGPIVEFHSFGNGRNALLQALKASDLLSRINADTADGNEIASYELLIEGRHSTLVPHWPGYKPGIIVGLEDELGRFTDWGRRAFHGVDALIDHLFVKPHSAAPNFSELLLKYLQRYHPDMVTNSQPISI